MPFTFGTATATPATGSLFGAAAPKPLFGTPTTTTAAAPTPGTGLFGASAPSLAATTTSSTGLFGATAPAATASGGLFGTTAKTTAATGGLFGSTTMATAPTAAGGGFFGSLTSTTTTPSLFGTTPSVTGTGSLFGKPTTGLFGSPATGTGTTAGGGFLGTAGAAPAITTTTIGLGGTGTLVTTGLTAGSSLGVAGAAASGSPMETEVPQVIMDLLNLLRENIKKSHELSDEFAMNSSDSCLHMNEKIEELMGMRVRYSETVRKAKDRANELLEKMQRDVRAAEQVRRWQKEVSKNPKFGRNQALGYLKGICTEHEETVHEFWETLKLLEDKINAKLNKKDVITKQDLQKHFEHYDQAFKVICSDVYRCKIQVQDLKDTFLEYRKNRMPYTPNPFERRKSDRAEKTSTVETRFTGTEAFPSQMTMMKIAEMTKSSSSAPSAGTGGIGTSGSLFGSKPFGSTGFSFNPSGTNTTAPLFKPFSATTTAAAPLFGSSTTSVAVGAPPPAPTTASSFTFGNTLNSSVSGTLFGGSASKPFGR